MLGNLAGHPRALGIHRVLGGSLLVLVTVSASAGAQRDTTRRSATDLA